MQRPTGVTIIAILGFFAAALLLLAAVVLCAGGNVMLPRAVHAGMTRMWVTGALVGVVLIGIAVLGVVTAIGLLKLRSWARILTIVAAGLTLLVAVLGLFDALAHVHTLFFFGALVRRVIVAAIDVWILVYLFQPDVKQAFGATGF